MGGQFLMSEVPLFLMSEVPLSAVHPDAGGQELFFRRGGGGGGRGALRICKAGSFFTCCRPSMVLHILNCMLSTLNVLLMMQTLFPKQANQIFLFHILNPKCILVDADPIP